MPVEHTDKLSSLQTMTKYILKFQRSFKTIWNFLKILGSKHKEGGCKPSDRLFYLWTPMFILKSSQIIPNINKHNPAEDITIYNHTFHLIRNTGRGTIDIPRKQKYNMPAR